MRSIATAASGRPAPRYAVVGTVLVTTETPLKPALAMSYAPVVISIVIAGRRAPRTGYAPASCTTSS